MKKKTILTYTTLVSLFLLLTCYSFFYSKYWHSKVYLSYLPEEIEYPEYDLKTKELTSSKTANFYNVSDYVPTYGLVMYKVYDFCRDWGAIFLILLIMVFIPQTIYCLPELRLKFGVLNSVQLVVALILLQTVII